VYGLPSGWAFSIWGIIFLSLAIFTVFQAVPAKYGGGLEDDIIASVRVPTLFLQAANALW
jgi:hypothetical protein